MFTKGKTVLVTGATDGIGKQTARVLAGQGAHVLVHGRSIKRVDAAIAEIKREDPHAQLSGYAADFSSLQAVRELAEELITQASDLQLLINNAGVYSPEFRLSQDGFELTFAVNHLAPFLLTLLLLPTLRRNAPARIINVVSIAHSVRDFNSTKIHDPSVYHAWNAYKISKFANVLATYRLAEQLAGSGVTVNCLHPGVVDTKMLRSAFPTTRGIGIEEGAKSSVYLASSDEVQGVSGAYFEDGKPVQSAPQTYDKELQRSLWKQCEDWVGLSG